MSSSSHLPRPRRRGPVNGDECYFWRTTGCHFGDKCRYKHIPDQKGKDRKPWQPWTQPTLCPSSVQETGMHRLNQRSRHLLDQLLWAKNIHCSRMDQNSQSQYSGSKAGIVTHVPQKTGSMKGWRLNWTRLLSSTTLTRSVQGIHLV